MDVIHRPSHRVTGYQLRDHARTAIQQLSGRSRSAHYAHTAGGKIGGRWCTCTGWCIGADGNDGCARESSRVRLAYALTRATTGDVLRNAVGASLDIRRVAPFKVTCRSRATYLATLREFFTRKADAVLSSMARRFRSRNWRGSHRDILGL